MKMRRTPLPATLEAAEGRTQRRRSPTALVAGALALAAGTAIVVGTLAVGSFSRAEAGQRATDLVRGEMTPRGLAQHRADFEVTGAAVEELYSEALPAIAAELDVSPEAFNIEIEVRYPAVAEFASSERRQEAYAFAKRILTNLEAHQEDFEQADAIPVGWMPMDLAPWLAVAVGGALALAGAAALLRPGLAALVVVAAIGVALVAGPLMTRYPQKAAAASNLLDSLTFGEEVVAQTRELMNDVDAAVAEIEEDLFPDVASGLGLTMSELDSLIDERFPAIAEARPQFDGILERYEARVRIREVGGEVIAFAAEYPLAAIGWWSIALGSVTTLAAGVVLRRARASANARSDDGFEPAPRGARAARKGEDHA